LLSPKQIHADLFFKIAHLPADPGLGNIELSGGVRKTSVLSNSAKVPEMTQLHNKEAYH
jgi:hypothetical protein